MAMLAHHDSITGPLTVADLEDARRNNPGSIWQISPHRMLPGRDTCNGSCETAPGCECHTACCAPEGGAFHDPAPAIESMYRHRRNRVTVSRVLMLAVVAYGTHLLWPLVAA